MSDFIARVAARAVGERAAVSPRVPALEAAAPGLEVIDEEVVVPAGDRTLAGAPAPLSPAQLPTRFAAPRPPLPLESATTPHPSDARFDQPSPEPEPPPRPARRVNDPARERTTQPAAPPRTRHERRALAEVALPSPMPRPALRMFSSAAARAVPAPVAAPAEPPAVRVHIGRLEVRANLHEQPQRTERAPAPRPSELSLSDYLRGRREHR